MAITDATIYTSLWNDIRSCLVAASIVVDSTTATINAGYNDKTAARPQLCILPIEKDEATPKFGGTEGKKMLNVFLECWGTKSSQVDSMAEQAEAAVKSYAWDGVQLVAITSNYALNVEADSKYHLKTVTFTFDRE